MNIEPRNLNVPLYGRDWSRVLLPIACGVAAWLWHRPTAIPQAVLSFVLGGAAFWFAICSRTSYRMLHHRVPIIRGVWFIAVVFGVVAFMRHVLPYLYALV